MKKGKSKQIVWLAKVKKHYAQMRKQERLKILFGYCILGILISTQTLADTTNTLRYVDVMPDSDRIKCLYIIDNATKHLQEFKEELKRDIKKN